jgi:hypothetical protein
LTQLRIDFAAAGGVGRNDQSLDERFGSLLGDRD